MATHSSILAWKILWTEEPGKLYSPWGHKESDTTERLTDNVNLQMRKLKLAEVKIKNLPQISLPKSLVPACSTLLPQLFCIYLLSATQNFWSLSSWKRRVSVNRPEWSLWQTKLPFQQFETFFFFLCANALKTPSS